jgi:hypothetical protein
MKKSYLVYDLGEGIIAVVKDIDSTKIDESNIDLINKVGQVVEDYLGLEERCKIIHGSIKSDNEYTFYINFKYNNEDDDEIIFEGMLIEIKVY